MIRYDLHLHSALSPCSDDDMTPNNIVNMAILNDLDFIAISDHNSLVQQQSIKKVAQGKIKILYGVEIQSKEEVHILAYFYKESQIDSMQEYLDQYLMVRDLDVNYFGHQYIMNERDEIVGEEKRLLLNSIDRGIEEIEYKIHELGGFMVLAHVRDRSNGIITQLGFIPLTLKYDGIEVKDEIQRKEVMAMHPWIKARVIWLYQSDAHTLGDIAKNAKAVEESEISLLWERAI